MKLSVIVPSLTGEVPKSLKADPRAELVVVKGVRPVAAARNEGLRRATGLFVAWVDADDEVADAWLDEIAHALEAHPDADVIAFDGQAEWCDGSGRAPYRLKTGDDLVRGVLRDDMPGQLWCKVWRRALFEGRSFVGAVHEDYRMECEIFRDAARAGRAVKVHYIPKVLYRYRRRSTGLSQGRDAAAVCRALLALARICWCRDMALGVWRRCWDFAKTPLRRLVR